MRLLAIHLPTQYAKVYWLPNSAVMVNAIAAFGAILHMHLCIFC
jgi:hypothetical protein